MCVCVKILQLLLGANGKPKTKEEEISKRISGTAYKMQNLCDGTNKNIEISDLNKQKVILFICFS